MAGKSLQSSGARAWAIAKRQDNVVTRTQLVDFYWPGLGLVVETDGLQYHRTPQQQTIDRLRDQTHTAAGLTCLRFTHYQVAREPRHVEATLVAVVRRLRFAA